MIAGASGRRMTQDLIPGRFLMARWSRNREAGVMAAPATRRVAMRAGVLDYCTFANCTRLGRSESMKKVYKELDLTFTKKEKSQGLGLKGAVT